MKKLIALLIACLIVPFSALAESSLSEMPDSELFSLLDDIRSELGRGNQSDKESSIDGDMFYAAAEALINCYKVPVSLSRLEQLQLNEEYYATTIDGGIRLVHYDSRIMKLSVRFDMDDFSTCLERMYMVSAILEGKLYEIDNITLFDMMNAIYSGMAVVDLAIDETGYNMYKVLQSGQEGFSLLASAGLETYRWEYINGSVWLSATIANLPDGVH